MALAQYNKNLENATIHYNSSLMPTPVPTFVPLTKATVTKAETESAWTFNVEIEGEVDNRYAYVAVYDADGRLVGLKKTNLSDTTSIEVSKTENDASAEILIWTDNAQPITEVETVELS